MKHNTKITAILIAMFLITQLIGMGVIFFYNQGGNLLPYGMEPPQADPAPFSGLISLLIAFVFAVLLFFLLTKLNAAKIIRVWFFLVSIIAIGLTLNVIFFKLNLVYPAILGILIGIPLAYIEIFKRNLIAVNFNKLLIYPGIGAAFVAFLLSILGEESIVFGVTLILLAISFYDIWAVWNSKFMEKMAKFQINNIGVFGGFFLPYANKKTKQKIKLLKIKYKNKSEKVKEKAFKKSKIKVNLAILGGGDVIFPIIAAGAFYVTMGLLPALMITAFSTMGLLALFIMARKNKFYPAMPFLTIAIYLGMIFNWLVF